MMWLSKRSGKNEKNDTDAASAHDVVTGGIQKQQTGQRAAQI
jgi:hypothetical protein